MIIRGIKWKFFSSEISIKHAEDPDGPEPTDEDVHMEYSAPVQDQ
jgi:hypothetical protein